MLLTSTAHQDATNLFIDARAAALAELMSLCSTLLLEWSALSGSALRMTLLCGVRLPQPGQLSRKNDGSARLEGP
jgi:hypothetical protein